MKRKYIEIEGIKIESEALFYLILCGTMKAQMESNDELTPEKRTKFLYSCVEQGKGLLNRLDEQSNPKK